MTGSIKWVQCDGGCNRWFHLACVGRTRIGKKENYWCATCSEAKKTCTPEPADAAAAAAANDDSQLSNTSTNNGQKRAKSKQNGSESKRFKEVPSDEDATTLTRLVEQIH